MCYCGLFSLLFGIFGTSASAGRRGENCASSFFCRANFQTLESRRPSSLLKLLLFLCISMTSLIFLQWKCRFEARIRVLSKRTACRHSQECSAIADFKGWFNRMARMCSVSLVETERPVSPMYTCRHPHGTWYTPCCRRPSWSLTGRMKAFKFIFYF